MLIQQAVWYVFNEYFSELDAHIGHETPLRDNDDIESIVSSYDGLKIINDIQIKTQHRNILRLRQITMCAWNESPYQRYDSQKGAWLW